MRINLFTIPANGVGNGELEELNQLLASKRIHNVDRQFVADGANSFWSICVIWQEQNALAKSPSGKARVDYREILSYEDFRVFVRLREIRKEIAQKDAVPAYAVFTNEQLAEIAKRRPKGLQTLQEIDGIGAARVEKYGSQVLGCMSA